MFEIVKDVNLAAHCLGGNDVMTLRHISGFVYLPFMVQFHVNRKLLLPFLRSY